MFKTGALLKDAAQLLHLLLWVQDRLQHPCCCDLGHPAAAPALQCSVLPQLLLAHTAKQATFAGRVRYCSPAAAAVTARPAHAACDTFVQRKHHARLYAGMAFMLQAEPHLHEQIGCNDATPQPQPLRAATTLLALLATCVVCMVLLQQRTRRQLTHRSHPQSSAALHTRQRFTCLL